MSKKTEEKLSQLLLHYSKGTQDIDTRRTRKNGWNDVVNAYMGKLPNNWPFLSQITDPRIRTTILEKTARLLNAKLTGRLVPREGGDVIKARIQNALLEFQWDYADDGGSMIEKVAQADQMARLFGAAFVLVYWDNKKNTNEIKVINPNDVWHDGAASHQKNSRWTDIREFTTIDKLEDRGYDMSTVRRKIKKGDITPDRQDTKYESQIKVNRDLENRVGEMDDPENPIIEVITEWTKERCIIYLPKYGEIVKDEENPYDHGDIPVSMLRYYPLGDDIYGESEVESVLPLQRAINAHLCAFNDEAILAMRPPLKISSSGVRIETIEYGPGAQWIMQNPNQVVEATIGGGVVQTFNATYPALVAAYNTAMGDSSLGVSNVRGSFTQKTATEVRETTQQQNSRDQYNQLYLTEFLKDIMMKWVSNNKQYLFDDPDKHYFVMKVIGKENVKYFQQMRLDSKDIPDYAMQEIANTVLENPEISEAEIMDIANDVAVPDNPVVMNPDEMPEKYDIKNKLDVKENGDEADLYLTKEDFDGSYDYIPDVKSMSVGAGEAQQQAQQKALEFALNPQAQQMLMAQGETINIKELISSSLHNGGYRDPDALFIPVNQMNNGNDQTGQAALGTGGIGGGISPQQGMGGNPQTLPAQPVNAGIPQTV